MTFTALVPTIGVRELLATKKNRKMKIDGLVKKSPNDWIPAFAGMTIIVYIRYITVFVIPAKAGIQENR